MADQAQVTCTDSIESFRADLIKYLSAAKPLVEDVFSTASRLREWVATDRRRYWEQELRRRTKACNEAEQALFSVRLLDLRAPRNAEQMAVTKTRAALAEAERKLAAVKRWTRDFDNRTQALLKEIEPIRTLLARDLPAGVAYLSQIVRRLDEYGGLKFGTVGGRSESTRDVEGSS